MEFNSIEEYLQISWTYTNKKDKRRGLEITTGWSTVTPVLWSFKVSPKSTTSPLIQFVSGFSIDPSQISCSPGSYYRPLTHRNLDSKIV